MPPSVHPALAPLVQDPRRVLTRVKGAMKDAMPKGPSDKDVDAALVRLVREKAEYFAVNRSSVRVTLSPASVTVSWWGEAGDDAPGYRGDRGTDGRAYREDMAHRTQVHNRFLDEIRHALQRSPYGSAVDLVKSEWGVPQDGEFYEFRVVKKPRTASSLSTPSMPTRATPMSKTPTLTASEQAALLRHASSLPVESDMRKVILAAVKVAAPSTWGQRLNELKQEYMSEVVREAREIIKSEGGKAAGGAIGVVGNLKGTSADGQPIQLTLQWGDGWSTIESIVYLGSDKRKGKHVVLSLSPSQVASESLYAHFQGLLP